MRQTKLSSEGKFGGKIVKINLQVILFEKDGIYFAYMPPLDLTGYGYNYDEARKSLEIVLD